MSKAGAHRAQGDPRLTHRGSTEPGQGAALVAARYGAHGDPGRHFHLGLAQMPLFLGSGPWLPMAACPAAGHDRSVALNVAHGRAVAVGGQVVGSGQVGLALDSLQIGLRPAQLEFFLVADAR